MRISDWSSDMCSSDLAINSYGRALYENFQHIGNHWGYAAHPHESVIRFGRSLDKIRTQQSCRFHQGPHRALDGGGSRKIGRAEAWRHDHRTNVGQYRDWSCHGRGGQRVQIGRAHVELQTLMSSSYAD